MLENHPDTSGFPRLVLYPAIPDYAPENTSSLVASLTELGLLGKPWRDHRYLTGNRFMQEIIFIGCSPFLRVEPQEDLDFCHIEIPEPATQAGFHFGAYSGDPRCPVCKSLLSHISDDTFCCRKCDHSLSAEQCLWRPGRTAIGRFLINIWGIQKGDAQPTEALMQILEKATGVPWKPAFL